MNHIELLNGIEKVRLLETNLSFQRGIWRDNTCNLVGVDPGKNFGITFVDCSSVSVYWGKLPPRKELGQSGKDARRLMFALMVRNIGNIHDITAIVEGAAYHSVYGQVGLEEVRFGFYLALAENTPDVYIRPPATVRKLATGSGKSQAGDEYVKLNHNAADSIYCAMAAKQLRRDN